MQETWWASYIVLHNKQLLQFIGPLGTNFTEILMALLSANITNPWGCFNI